MTTSAPRRARYRPWLVAAVASSAVLVPAMTAAATWQNSSITLIEFRDVCRDGVRFGGAVRAGTADNDPQYNTMAVAAQPPPAAWADKPPLAMRTAIKIPRLPAPEDIIVDDDPTNAATVSHLGSFTLRYAVADLDPGAHGTQHPGRRPAEQRQHRGRHGLLPVRPDRRPARLRRPTRCRSATVT